MEVKCPHCTGVLRNDTRTAGRAVLCPFCNRQLQMPPLAPIPVGPGEPRTDGYRQTHLPPFSSPPPPPAPPPVSGANIPQQSTPDFGNIPVPPPVSGANIPAPTGEFKIDTWSAIPGHTEPSAPSGARYGAARRCKYCGNPVAHKAKRCPTCGQKSSYSLEPEEYGLGALALTLLVGVVCLVVMCRKGDDHTRPPMSPAQGRHTREPRSIPAQGRHTGEPRSIEQLDAVPYAERTAEEKRRGKEWADRDFETRVRPNVERMMREREQEMLRKGRE